MRGRRGSTHVRPYSRQDMNADSKREMLLQHDIPTLRKSILQKQSRDFSLFKNEHITSSTCAIIICY